MSDERPAPYTIELPQNYPNPFNSTTAISYKIPYYGNVKLTVYNILGHKVMEIDRGYEEAGWHTIQLDPEGLSSGVYLYRISANMVSKTNKLLLIR